MGIIEYARNNETKEAYELGKGCWVSLTDSEGFIDTSDVTMLAKKIGDSVIKEPIWTKEAAENLDYHLRIAKALNALGAHLELVNDSTMWYPLEGFRLVGSRYDL